MVKSSDIKRLLKGRLTGKEAAKLILQDSWEVDHGRDGFLSPGDIQRIKSGLTGQEADEYNRWIRAYQLVDYNLKEARIFCLEASRDLVTATRWLEEYDLEDRIRSLMLFGLPAIVTQKQYDELKAKQRDFLLQEPNMLWLVIDERAYELATEEQREASNLDSATLAEEYPELRKLAIQDVIQAIQEGKLQPVKVDRPALKKKLRPLERRKAALRAREKEHPEEQEAHFEAWLAIGKKETQILQDFYRAGKEAQSQESQAELIRELEEFREGALPARQEEALLEYTFVTGAELYQTGWPYWINVIEEYKPALEEGSLARPMGMMQSWSVAIIQDPAPEDVDERGYYKDKGAKALTQLSGYEQMNRLRKEHGLFAPDSLKKIHKKVKERIKAFLAIQAVTEAISEAIGVQMTEDLEQWYEEIDAAVNLFNTRLEPANEYREPPYYLGMPKLSSLRIGKLKPTAKAIQYYRERMAIGLGENWWEELLHTLEDQEPEEGSLAEEMLGELKEAGNGKE